MKLTGRRTFFAEEYVEICLLELSDSF